MNNRVFKSLLISFVFIVCVMGIFSSCSIKEKNEFITKINEFNRRYTEEEREVIFSKLDKTKVVDVVYQIETAKRSILYDFNERPTYSLIEYNTGGYEIINNLSGNSVESTSDGESPYHNMSGTMYYGGFGTYSIKKQGTFINILTNKIMPEEQISFYADFSDYLVINEYQENIAEVKLKYKKMTSNEDRENNSTMLTNDYFQTLTPDKDFTDGDSFPNNNGTSCGIVATVMLYQYYERTGTHVIPRAFLDTVNSNVAEELHDYLDGITAGGALGENYTNNLIDGIEKFNNTFFAKRNERLYKIRPVYNACYDNMVANIDNGKPAVGMTSMGNGYYQLNGEWKETSAGRHHMVVYGYCTTDAGTLKDFICHSGWKNISGTQKMYVYKLNFASNYSHNLEYVGG